MQHKKGGGVYLCAEKKKKELWHVAHSELPLCLKRPHTNKLALALDTALMFWADLQRHWDFPELTTCELTDSLKNIFWLLSFEAAPFVGIEFVALNSMPTFHAHALKSAHFSVLELLGKWGSFCEPAATTIYHLYYLSRKTVGRHWTVKPTAQLNISPRIEDIMESSHHFCDGAKTGRWISLNYALVHVHGIWIWNWLDFHLFMTSDWPTGGVTYSTVGV